MSMWDGSVRDHHECNCVLLYVADVWAMWRLLDFIPVKQVAADYLFSEAQVLIGGLRSCYIPMGDGQSVR